MHPIQPLISAIPLATLSLPYYLLLLEARPLLSNYLDQCRIFQRHVLNKNLQENSLSLMNIVMT